MNWLAGEWLSSVRSPVGKSIGSRSLTVGPEDIYHKLIWLSAKRTDGIKYRNIGWAVAYREES